MPENNKADNLADDLEEMFDEDQPGRGVDSVNRLRGRSVPSTGGRLASQPNSALNQKADGDQEAGGQVKPKKSDRNQDVKRATKGVAQLATGNLIGGIYNLAKVAKNNWKPILSAFAAVVVIGGLLGLFFFIGITNMLPGSPSGTTFTQSNIDYDTLNALRIESAGAQRDRALIIEIQKNGIQNIIAELGNIKKEVDQKQLLSGQKLVDFNSLVDDTVNKIQTLGSVPPGDQSNNEAIVAQIKPIGDQIYEIVDTFEKMAVGQAGLKGLYQLPNSPYYNKQNAPARQYGQKELIIALTNAARDFNQLHKDQKFAIGDISLNGGGEMPTKSGKTTHRQWTHKCGLDVDIVLSPNNGVLTVGSSSFNKQIASNAADALIKNGFKRILYEYPGQDSRFFRITSGPNKDKYITGHKNHIHARLTNDWDKYPDCLPKTS